MAEEYFEHRNIIPKTSVEKALIWYETFVTRREWNLGGTGTDYLIRRHPGYHVSGDYGLELQTKLITPAVDDMVFIQYSFPLAQSPVIHLACLFAVALTLTSQDIEIKLAIPNLTDQEDMVIQVKINTATRKVYIRKSDNTYVEVGTLVALTLYQWNYLELTYNRNTDYYKTLKINEQDFTVSSYKAYKDTTHPNYSYRFVEAKLTTLTADKKRMYLDHFIVRTQPY